jgi:hypothetical protein
MSGFFDQRERSVVVRTITREQQDIAKQQKELLARQKLLNEIKKDYNKFVSQAVQIAVKSRRRARGQKRRRTKRGRVQL